MIFICLTPNPKGEHLKIIELRSPPLWGIGGQRLFGVDSTLKLHRFSAWQALRNSYIILIPEKRRCHSFLLFKHVTEIENRLKSKFVADFLDAFVG